MRRLIGSTLILLASSGWAVAALGPLEAAAILTEAKAVNTKCKFLTPAESDRMSLFAARAEVAAVSAESADKAGGALQKARTRGNGMACDDSAKARVREIYAAASEAMDAVTREQPPAAGPVNILPKPKTAAQPKPQPPLQPVQAMVQPAPQAPAPQPLIQPQPQQRPQYNFNAQQAPAPQPQYVYAQPEPEPQPQYVYAQPDPVPQPQYVYAEPQYVAPAPQPIVARRFLARFSVVLENPPAQPVYQPQVQYAPQVEYAPQPIYSLVSDVSGGIENYVRRATAYYVEMRCQHLSQADAQLFWQSIASQHAALLEREAPHNVEAAVGQAQAQAAQMACSSQSAQFVRDSFQH